MQKKLSRQSPQWIIISPIHVLVFAIAFAALVPTAALAKISHSDDRSEGPIWGVNQEDLLWWLPADTESVVTARGPFPLSAPSDDEDENSGKGTVSQAEIFVELAQQPLELLYSQPRGVAVRLEGSVVALAMQGSRHFRHPLPDLEVGDFEGCSIVVFDDSFGERGQDLMQTLAGTATAMKIVAETQVLVFHHKLLSAEWDSFLALPRPNLLLAANNLAYLQEILVRMTRRKTPRALPSQLPEWRFVDPDMRFWGLRHYDRAQAKLDPTSPFGEGRTFGPGDPKAIGIVFALDAKNERKASVTVLSGNEAMIRDTLSRGTASEEAEIASFCGHEVVTRDSGMTYQDEAPEAGVHSEVELWSPAPGVLQRSYTVDQAGILGYFTLTMQTSLGRGMWF